MNELLHPSGSNQRSTVLQLLKIANINCDLDRSREDTDFADKDGRIIYVFDENIFEMFVKPYKHFREIETFYGEVWESPEVNRATRKSYESQAALIASEFLVSRALPGSQGEPIYMTEPHRWELYKRLTGLTDTLRANVDAHPETIVRSLNAKFAVLRDLEVQTPQLGSRQQFSWSTALQADLERDLAYLSEISAPKAVLDRVAATRIAADFLAADKLSEPLDQLRRLMSPTIRNRIRDLQDRINCPESARKSIESDQKFWLKKLDEELARPANRLRTRSINRESAEAPLRNDAYSIAYLRWCAKRSLVKGERLVFITNDELVFDTYRRWYVSDECDASVEPFFMRRASQYGPIFIPRDSGGDLSHEEHVQEGRQSIFDQVQSAIEFTLIPLVEAAALSEGLKSQADGLFSKSRERLALKLVDFQYPDSDADIENFIAPVAPNWLNTQTESLKDIRTLWQAAHRLVIGASYGLISSRLSAEQRVLSERLSLKTVNDVTAFLNEYAQNVLDSLMEESIQWCLPLARDFILGRGREPEFIAPSYLRISVALDLQHQFPELSLERSPDLVFAQAALRALDIQDAHNANRFAKLALRANQATRCDMPDVSGVGAELEYLAAVSCRLLICTVNLRDRSNLSNEENARVLKRGIDQIKYLYNEASIYLRNLIGLHHSGKEGQNHDASEHQVRFLRAVSERASLNLFTATAFGLARTKKGEGGHEARDASVYLEQARLGLRACASQDVGLADCPILDLVRSQYLPNIAAWEVLAYLIDPSRETQEQWPRQALVKLRRYEKGLIKPHPLLKAELVGYRNLNRKVGVQAQSLGHREFIDGIDKLRMPLDKTLYREIYARIFDVNIHKPKRTIEI